MSSARPPVTIPGVLAAWVDLRGSMRRVLGADLREGSLLAMALASGLIWFLGRMAALWLSPEAAAAGEAALIGRAQAELVAAVFFRTLALYGVAALAGLVAGAFGGTGSWRASRAATFWSALVAAPVDLAATVLAALLQPVAAPAVPIMDTFAGLAFAWAFSFCIAEAHGFRSGLFVLAAVAVPSAVFFLSGLLFG